MPRGGKRKGPRGGGGGKRGRGGRGGSGGKPFWKADDWTEIVKNNDAFNAYYKAQNLMPESEFEEFLETLREPLPTTFRISPSGPFANAIRDQIKGRVRDFFVDAKTNDDEPVALEPPRLLTWYPDELAWHVSIGRKSLRKSVVYERFQRFLVNQNSTGHITRQEAVSMIPPLFLDVQSGHKVLDMCAAPGSKTSQLVEFLGQQQAGLICANDADNARCHLLVHQLKRLASPNIMVTNSMGQMLPNMYLAPAPGAPADAKPEQLRFDRVLADVPCGGDGTFRKSPDMWRRWSCNDGIGLHRLQYLILMRGLELLQVGGRIVYSTCSLNPLENESVVAAAIKEWGGSVEIVDVSSQLPTLLRRPGLTEWVVPDKHGNYFKKMEDAADSKDRYRLHESMFAPANAKEIGLERCVRVLPHQQDTGGFFITAMVKKAEKPKSATATASEAELKESEAATSMALEGEHKADGGDGDGEKGAGGGGSAGGDGGDGGDGNTGGKPDNRRGHQLKKAQQDEGLRELPADIGTSIKDFFGLDSGFDTSLLVTTSSTNRHITYCSPTLHRFVKTQIGLKTTQPRLIAAGVKMFEYSDAKAGACVYRMRQEAAHMLIPHMKKRVVTICEADFVKFLKERNVKHADITTPEAREALEAMPGGAVVLICQGAETKPGVMGKMHAVAWRSGASTQLFVSKEEVANLTDLLLPEDAMKRDEEEAKRKEAAFIAKAARQKVWDDKRAAEAAEKAAAEGKAEAALAAAAPAGDAAP